MVCAGVGRRLRRPTGAVAVRPGHPGRLGQLDGATLWQATRTSSRVRVTHNSARAGSATTSFPGPASALFIGARNDQVLVHRNRVHAASGNGIDVTDSAEPDQGNEDQRPSNVTVSKNKVRQAELAGLHMATETSGGAAPVAYRRCARRWLPRVRRVERP